MSEAGQDSAAIRSLANLLTLQRKARQSGSLAEVEFLLVNDSNLVAPYNNAILWRNGQVAGMSGVPVPAKDAPYGLWATRLCRDLARKYGQPAEVRMQEAEGWVRDEWPVFFPTYGLWLPLIDHGHGNSGLLLGRSEAWQEGERRLLEHWTEAVGTVLEALGRRERWHNRAYRWINGRRRLVLAGAAVAMIAVGAFPVRLSVQATAEVIPFEPMVVRAPLNGVIEDVPVKPNMPVAKGQVLLKFDEREIQAKLDVVRQSLEAAQAEYRLTQQAAISSKEAQANLTILRERIEQRRAEVAQTESLLQRSVVAADRDGIALLANADALKGRPVKIGERLMTVADPDAAELELWISASDSVPLHKGSEVDFYLNIEPTRPHRAALLDVSYQASLSPANILGYRAIARFADRPLPRIGLRGTARVHGDDVPLAYYLLRRPLTALREVIGF